MALKFGSFHTILTLDILVIIGSLNECIGNENHLHIARTMDEISYELDACSVCKNYEPTQLRRACSVGNLTDDVHELKRVLGEVWRTYERTINTGIEEEERNGMYIGYTYQKAFTGDTLSWMRKYDTIHNMLQEIYLHMIYLNMTDMEQLDGSRLMPKFLHPLTDVMCPLQAILKFGSFAKEDTHLQITCRRTLVISRNFENTQSPTDRINFVIRYLLTARDALNEISDVLK